MKYGTHFVKRLSGALGWGLFMAAMAAASLTAQDAGQGASGGARAVRLSSVEGRVQVSQNDQMLADPAVVNTPLLEGTEITTADDGRAEIQFEDGSVARLSPNSALTLTVLRPDDGAGATEIVVERGLTYFELQSADQPGKIQIRFDGATVTASGAAVLRINLDKEPFEVAVFSGNARVERGSDLSLDLRGGESVALDPGSAEKYNLAETIEPDSWDTWNSDRDQVLTSESASRTEATESFGNSSNPAWNDLDANGNWYNVPGQGYVWSPYDAANPGWDPYGNGNWMWEPGFGYTWVSGDAWGYLPFSCGAWSFYGGFGWGWSPGIGACSPWWGGGGYFINIAGIGPPGWLPPRRPPNRYPGRPGGGRRIPIPLIAVNKRPASGWGVQAPRNRDVSATIAGHVVMPLKPVSPRPVYDRTTTTYVNRTPTLAPGAPGVKAPYAGPGGVVSPLRPGYIPPPSRPAGGALQAPVRAPAAPPSRPPASAPAYHPPAASGGGGAAHAGGGGGGGGSVHH